MVSAEQKSQTPQTGKTNYCVDDPADDGILSTEDPGNKVKFEKTYKAPVDRANNGKNQI